MKSARDAQEIDKAVGERIRALRIQRGLTQQQLAEMIGLTYQQAHKYERGINRVSAGRLVLLARVLNVSPLDLLPSAPLQSVGARERMSLEIARTLSLLGPHEQEAVAALVRTLAAGPKVAQAA